MMLGVSLKMSSVDRPMMKLPTFVNNDADAATTDRMMVAAIRPLSPQSNSGSRIDRELSEMLREEACTLTAYLGSLGLSFILTVPLSTSPMGTLERIVEADERLYRRELAC